MKALKWIGGAVLALIAIAWYFAMDKSEQRWIGLAVFGGYMGYLVINTLTEMEKRLSYRLDRIHERIEHVAQEVYALDKAIADIGNDQRGA